MFYRYQLMRRGLSMSAIIWFITTNYKVSLRISKLRPKDKLYTTKGVFIFMSMKQISKTVFSFRIYNVHHLCHLVGICSFIFWYSQSRSFKNYKHVCYDQLVCKCYRSMLIFTKGKKNLKFLTN